MPISQDSFSNSMGQHRDHTEEIFLLEPINFLKQFCRQPPANPLQFSIPRAILAPCGKTVFHKRKNWIHLGSKEAGPRVAAIISVVETCRRLKIPVRDYLGSALPGLADFPISRIAELTPTAWANRN
jgi:hypothetical protein